MQQQRNPLSTQDINGPKINQYGQRMQVPEGVDPYKIAGTMPSKKRDEFGNHYEQMPQGNGKSKN